MFRSRCLNSVLLTGVLVGLPLLSQADQAEPQVRKLPSVGEKAPDFTLKDFRGTQFTLTDLKGHEAALLWLTNLCEGCRSKFTEMEKLKSKYGGKGIEVIAVSQLGKDRKTVDEAIRANHLSMRFLYDPTGEITARYSGRYVPLTCPLTNLYVIDEDGTIVYATHYPGVPEAEITGELEKLRVATAKGGK